MFTTDVVISFSARIIATTLCQRWCNIYAPFTSNTNAIIHMITHIHIVNVIIMPLTLFFFKANCKIFLLYGRPETVGITFQKTQSGYRLSVK
jgi:hypothetical protein